jgi:hypothetical protein
MLTLREIFRHRLQVPPKAVEALAVAKYTPIKLDLDLSISLTVLGYPALFQSDNIRPVNIC